MAKMQGFEIRLATKSSQQQQDDFHFLHHPKNLPTNNKWLGEADSSVFSTVCCSVFSGSCVKGNILPIGVCVLGVYVQLFELIIENEPPAYENPLFLRLGSFRIVVVALRCGVWPVFFITDGTGINAAR